MSFPSSTRSLASVLTNALRGPDAFTLQVVFTGKVKPVELTLYEVLADGIRAAPFFGDGNPPEQLYPFSGITSIAVSYNEAPAE